MNFFRKYIGMLMGILVFMCLFNFDAYATTPTISNLTTTNIKATTATLNATFTNGGNYVNEYGFYWRKDSESTSTRSVIAGTGANTGPYAYGINGLTPGIKYVYRAFVVTSLGETQADLGNFTTASATPTVVSGSATNIKGLSATMNGSFTISGGVNVTEWGFYYYGTSSSNTPERYKVGTTSSSGGSFAYALSSLTPSTTYYYKAYAKNAYGEGIGVLKSFTTASATPTVVSSSATDVKALSATMNGSLTISGGVDVTEWGFYYYGTSSSNSPERYKVGTTSSSGGSFAYALSSLTPSTTYYYKAYAKNAYGEGIGGLNSFTTLSSPRVTTNNATTITGTTATINGYIDANDGFVIAESGFWYGTVKADLNNQTIVTGTGTENRTLTAAITGLTAGTKYYYKAYAKSEKGTGSGDILDFTTSNVTVLKKVVFTNPTSNNEALNVRDNLEIKWYSPDTQVSTEIVYNYNLLENDVPNSKYSKENRTTASLTVLFDDLDSTKTYTVNVWAVPIDKTNYQSSTKSTISFTVNKFYGDNYETKNGYTDNNTIGRASTIDLSTTGVTTINSATIHKSTDVDYYKITIPEQGGYSFSLTNPSGADYRITLPGFSSDYIETNLISGIYYLKVESFGGYSDNPYELTISKIAGDKFEPNNSFYAPYKIVTNANYEATLHSTSDKDYYSISISEPKYLKITLSQPIGCKYNFEIYKYIDSSGGYILYASPNGKVKEIEDDEFEDNFPAGDYCIILKPYSGGITTNNYTISIRDDRIDEAPIILSLAPKSTSIFSENDMISPVMVVKDSNSTNLICYYNMNAKDGSLVKSESKNTSTGTATFTAFSLSSINEGVYTISYSVKDANGNVVPTVEKNEQVIIDKSKPTYGSINISMTDKSIKVLLLNVNDKYMNAQRPFSYRIYKKGTTAPLYSEWLTTSEYIIGLEKYNELLPNTEYTIEVRIRDYVAEKNGLTSSTHLEFISQNKFTLAQKPSLKIIDNLSIANNSIILRLDTAILKNPTNTKCKIEVTDGNFKKYVSQTGDLVDEQQWITLSAGNITVNNLIANKTYKFKIKAKNENGIETEYSDEVIKTTLK